MAKILQAVRDYGPKLELGPTAQLKEQTDWMASRTGLNPSEVSMVLQETSAMLLAFLNRGIPVKLPGVGIFTPSIDRHGVVKVNLRVDTALKDGCNARDAYHGAIVNRERMGLSDEEYKALWDAAHPDDPLEI